MSSDIDSQSGSSSNLAQQKLMAALTAFDSGNPAAAEPLLKEALVKLHPQSADFSKCANCLTEIFIVSGRMKDAKSLNRRIIDQIAPLPGDFKECLASAIQRLARVKESEGDSGDELNSMAAAVRAGELDGKTIVSMLTSDGSQATPSVPARPSAQAASPPPPPPPPPPQDSHSPPGVGTPASPQGSAAPTPTPNSAPSGDSARAGSIFKKSTAPMQPKRHAAEPLETLNPSFECLERRQIIELVAESLFSRRELVLLHKDLKKFETLAEEHGLNQEALSSFYYHLYGVMLGCGITNQKGKEPSTVSHIVLSGAIETGDLQGSLKLAPQEEPKKSPETTPPSAGSPTDSPLESGARSTPARPSQMEKVAEADEWASPSPDWADVEEQTQPGVHSTSVQSWSAGPELDDVPENSGAFEQSGIQPFSGIGESASDSDFDSGDEDEDDNESAMRTSFVGRPSQLKGAAPRDTGDEDSDGADSNMTSSIQTRRNLRSTMKSEDIGPPQPEKERSGLFGALNKDDAKAASSREEDDDDADKLAVPKESKSSKLMGVGIVELSIVFVVIVGLAFGSVALAHRLLPGQTTAKEAFKNLEHKYASADGRKKLTFSDENHCELTIGSETVNPSCNFYLNDWQSFVSLSMSPLLSSPRWMVRSGTAIKDSDGTLLYPSDGLEGELLTEVETIELFASNYYGKNKKYPSSADPDESGSRLSYVNPYTEEKELPIFDKVTIGDESSKDESNKIREEFLQKLRRGKAWVDAPDARAGQIRCCAVRLLRPEGTSRMFVIQPIGQDEKALSGSSPEQSFYKIYENGSEIKNDSGNNASSSELKGRMGIFPLSIWIFAQDPETGLRSNLAMIPALIFTLLSGAFGLLALKNPSAIGKVIMIVMVILFAIPAIIFDINFLMIMTGN